MDSYEATRMVFSRIQNLDPENASKIMGYLLIQDHGEKEMIRLAFGPENLIHSLIFKAKTHLGLLSSSNNTPSTTTPSSTPISRPNPLSISSSSRISTNGGVVGFDITNPSTPSTNAPWSPHSPSNGFTSSLSYANIVNGTSNATGSESLSSNATMSSSAFPYYGNNNSNNYGGDVVDDYHHLQDHLSFLNDSKADDLFDPRMELAMSPSGGYGGGDAHLHRRSFSVPGGVCYGSPDDANSGLGWKQCLYFAKGFCKNGSSCKFLHGDSADNAAINIGSPNKLNEFEQCQELLRSKAAAATQQRKLAAASQFMGAVSFPYNKSAAAALMIGDELHKFGRCRPERNHDFSAMGLGGSVNNPGSRQIYLTFPADSTFREEDVSNYFSARCEDTIPAEEDVWVCYFFVSGDSEADTGQREPPFRVRFACAREALQGEGKVPEKKQHQQQMERGEYSACSSPSGPDSREPFDFHLGARMFYNTQEMLLRRKLEEQADMQQAIELQGRRLINLQLLDLKNNNHHHHHHHHQQFHHGISNGSPVPSPTLSHTPSNKSLIFPLDGMDGEVPEENGGSPVADTKNAVPDADQKEMNPTCNHNNGNGNSSNKEEKSNTEESDLHESLEHILPDNLFASPKKSTGDHFTAFSTTSSAETDEKYLSSTTSSNNTTTLLPSNSTLSVASLKSCFLQMPRFSSGHGTIGM
ncbi:hypothetical protein JRO89_XS10G0063600 [Xanthoceras sorbifolium]|uniref:C3H1-type domain-containing protein n=1 Tax=Xanthoceras sorbifolium TaxID=99658 RepID=A0ABQ8HHV2_9ROSI|nr:hypothetical protein JRO89_XS10G0063600 [Xanthoceras sorbifolium]